MYWWRYLRLNEPRSYTRAIEVAQAGYGGRSRVERQSVQPVLRADLDRCFADSASTVFAYGDYFHFGVLTSGFHCRWAVRHASSLRTDVRYTPSDVFETFPQPPYSKKVAEAGEKLDTLRTKIMRGRGLGLTSVYNLVHDPDCG